MQNIGIQGITGAPSPSATSGISRSVGMPSLSKPKESDARSFGQMLNDGLNTANSTLAASGKVTDKLMTGEIDNLHQVSIAGAKAEVMMKLTTKVTSSLARTVTQLFQMQL